MQKGKNGKNRKKEKNTKKSNNTKKIAKKIRTKSQNSAKQRQTM